MSNSTFPILVDPDSLTDIVGAVKEERRRTIYIIGHHMGLHKEDPRLMEVLQKIAVDISENRRLGNVEGI